MRIKHTGYRCSGFDKAHVRCCHAGVPRGENIGSLCETCWLDHPEHPTRQKRALKRMRSKLDPGPIYTLDDQGRLVG